MECIFVIIVYHCLSLFSYSFDQNTNEEPLSALQKIESYQVVLACHLCI